MILPQSIFHSLRLGHIASDRINPLPANGRCGFPLQRAIRAVLASITVVEIVRALTLRELCSLGQCAPAIVGMNKVDKWRAQQFLDRETEGRFPRRIENFEVAVKTGDTKQVQ